MSYEYRCLMRRRLELYHDLLTEQLRPRIEAAAAVAATANATIEATTDNPDSDTEQCMDDDADNTDDTDDSDEDLCEWEHAEDSSSEEPYARVTQWRCGLERNGIWEDDALDHGQNDEKRSDQVELEQPDDDKASTTTEVHHVEHTDKGKAVDTSVQNPGGPLTPLSVVFALDHIAKVEEQGHMDDATNTSGGPKTTEREADNTARARQMASGSISLKDNSPDDFTAAPSSPCRESSVTASPVSTDERNHPASLRQPNLTLFIPTNSRLFQSPRRSKSLPPLNLLPSHCPPTPPPDTSSSAASTYSLRPFTVTPAELRFFNRHIEQVEYMIRGIDYQFQMQEYRNEIRRQNRRKRRRAEVEERMREMEWSNKVPSEDWSNGADFGEAEWTEGTTEETQHQSRENDAVTPESNSAGLQGDESADTKGESADEPILYTQGDWGETYGTDGHEDDVDSVWPDGVGEDDGCETGWGSAWSTTQLESEEKIQPHQPTNPSPLRKGYTPDDMVWEDAVAEAEYLSYYGHQSKKDERGRRYWRL